MTAAVFVGRVFDVLDEELSVWRTPNGSAVILGSRGTKLGLDADQLAAFRELLGSIAGPCEEEA